MQTRLIALAVALLLTVGTLPTAFAQPKSDSAKVGRYTYIASGAFVIMVDTKTEKTYVLTGPDVFMRGRGEQMEFAWVPIAKYLEFDSEIVGQWQLNEVGGKKLKETEIFDFQSTGKLRYSYSRGPIVNSFRCTYGITGSNQMVINLPGNEKQELTWSLKGDALILTDMQTKEVSKLTRYKGK